MTKCHRRRHSHGCCRPRCYSLADLCRPCYPCYPFPIICAQPCIQPQPQPLSLSIINGIITLINNTNQSYPGGIISFSGTGNFVLPLLNINGSVPASAILPALGPYGSISGSYTATNPITAIIGNSFFTIPPSFSLLAGVGQSVGGSTIIYSTSPPNQSVAGGLLNVISLTGTLTISGPINITITSPGSYGLPGFNGTLALTYSLSAGGSAFIRGIFGSIYTNINPL